MNDCWEEMARQIKTFKRKYRKVETCDQKEEAKESEASASLYETTHQFIQKSWESGNPLDHKDLLKNLSLVIADGRLNPDSNGFDKICKLVREWMPINSIKDIFNQNSAGKSVVKISKSKILERIRFLNLILFWILLKIVANIYYIVHSQKVNNNDSASLL